MVDTVATWRCLKKLDQPFMYVGTQLFLSCIFHLNTNVKVLLSGRKKTQKLISIWKATDYFNMFLRNQSLISEVIHIAKVSIVLSCIHLQHYIDCRVIKCYILQFCNQSLLLPFLLRFMLNQEQLLLQKLHLWWVYRRKHGMLFLSCLFYFHTLIQQSFA